MYPGVFENGTNSCNIIFYKYDGTVDVVVLECFMYIEKVTVSITGAATVPCVVTFNHFFQLPVNLVVVRHSN